MSSTEIYVNPLVSRYAGREMLEIFSPDRKFKTWRDLWIALAEVEHELGLPITEEQIAELKANRDNINYDVAAAEEKRLRHDVMAHVHAYGKQCPKAAGIIHLGATSCYVTDNTDLILMRDALGVIREHLLHVISLLARFADEHKALPTLGFTHYQPAQPVTLGKRATLWIQDLMADLSDLDYIRSQIHFHGCRGTTGTQASFMSLFENDSEKAMALDQMIAEKMGFEKVYPVSGQTYSRKLDFRILAVLSSIAQSAHKFANDLRLMQNLKEIEEPFEKTQIGSSAMAYKRNPMRSERMTSLSRLVISLTHNPAQTAAEQWLERTLDDSANKRIAIPEAFLATDAILRIYRNVASGIVVYPKRIAYHLSQELPFMATENIMMEATKRGGNRQELHEAIRQHSMAAGREIKEFGRQNDLFDRIAADPLFKLDREELEQLLVPDAYIGLCPEQVTNFLERDVRPLLEKEHIDSGEDQVKLNV